MIVTRSYWLLLLATCMRMESKLISVGHIRVHIIRHNFMGSFTKLMRLYFLSLESLVFFYLNVLPFKLLIWVLVTGCQLFHKVSWPLHLLIKLSDKSCKFWFHPISIIRKNFIFDLLIFFWHFKTRRIISLLAFLVHHIWETFNFVGIKSSNGQLSFHITFFHKFSSFFPRKLLIFLIF